jgi:hypothetical protein
LLKTLSKKLEQLQDTLMLMRSFIDSWQESRHTHNYWWQSQRMNVKLTTWELSMRV